MRFLCPFPRLDGACLGTVGHRPDPVGFAKKCSKEVYNILKHSEIDQFSHQEWFSEELDKGQPSQRSKIRLSPTVLELLVFKHSWQNFAAPKKGTHTITHTHISHDFITFQPFFSHTNIRKGHSFSRLDFKKSSSLADRVGSCTPVSEVDPRAPFDRVQWEFGSRAWCFSGPFRDRGAAQVLSDSISWVHGVVHGS